MKALFLDDEFLTEENIFTPENKEYLSVFEDMEYEFVKDTNPVRWGMGPEYIMKIEKEGPEGWIIPDEEVMEKIETADILIVHVSGVTREMMEKGKNLKAIFCLRSGVEGINTKAAAELGISVSNCPSRLAEPVSDMAIAFMLSECRGLVRGNLIATNGDWQREDIYQDKTNSPLCYLNIGLIGYGGIAQRIAKKLGKGFGCQIMAYDPYMPKEVMDRDGVIYCETQEEMLKKSDIVSMHARLTEDTRNMFGEKEFKQMKPTALFINTARAGLVDEAALVKALQDKTIRGAGLDVFAEEPIPKDHPFLKMNNVTMMAHRAGATTGMFFNTVRGLLVPEIERFVKGETLEFKVN